MRCIVDCRFAGVANRCHCNRCRRDTTGRRDSRLVPYRDCCRSTGGCDRRFFSKKLRLYSISDRLFIFRIDRSRMELIVSTPAANTRRRAASRSRSGSDSRVCFINKTLIYCPTQQHTLQIPAHEPFSTTSSASITFIFGLGTSNARANGKGLPVETNPGLQNQQNPSPDPAVAALLQLMSQ